MSAQDYRTVIVVDQTPEQAFAAINNVRGWWSGQLEGNTDKLGDEFTYRVPDVHWCKMRITESVPGKRVAWHVLDSWLGFTQVPNEWNGTDITFDISEKDGKTKIGFTHVGLVPAFECHEVCANSWGVLVHGNLPKLIATGEDQPFPWPELLAR